jgi:hypothetical protein
VVGGEWWVRGGRRVVCALTVKFTVQFIIAEACNSSGASDGVIHSRTSLKVICFRAITNYLNI